MKKGIKFLLISLLGISVFLPYSCINNVNNENALGTIGKVKKYHKDQMSEKDIKLRSEITEDTAKLLNTINGLIVYSAYSKTLATTIDKDVKELDSCNCYDGDKADLLEMKKLGEFIENSDPMLEKTILMLADFYNDDVSEASFDVEHNLRNFANFVNQLGEKSEILSKVVDGMDSYIAENIDVKANSQEIEKLKAIRDQLLIRDVQGAIVMNNQEHLKTELSDKGLYNADILNNSLMLYAQNLNSSENELQNSELANEQLNLVLARDELNIVFSRDELNVVLSRDELNNILGILQSTNTLGLLLMDNETLNNIHNLSMASGLENINSLGKDFSFSAKNDLGAQQGLESQEQINATSSVNAIVLMNTSDLAAFMSNINSALNGFLGFSSEINSMEAFE